MTIQTASTTTAPFSELKDESLRDLALLARLLEPVLRGLQDEVTSMMHIYATGSRDRISRVSRLQLEAERVKLIT